MAKFQIGEQVLVKKGLIDGQVCRMEDNPGNCFWIPEHHGEYVNQHVTIASLYKWNNDSCWVYKIREDCGDDFWTDDMFEIVEHLTDIETDSLMSVIAGF